MGRCTSAAVVSLFAATAVLNYGCVHTGRSAASRVLDCPEEELSDYGASENTWSGSVTRYTGCGRTVECRELRVGPKRFSDACEVASEPAEASRDVVLESEQSLRLTLLQQGCANPLAETQMTAKARWVISACGRTYRCHATATGPKYECLEAAPELVGGPVVVPPIALPLEPRKRPLGSTPSFGEPAPRSNPRAELELDLQARERKQEWPEAKATWRRFLNDTNDAGARVEFAQWLWRHRFPEEALAEAQEVQKQQPTQGGLHSMIGRLLLETGHPTDARPELHLATREDPRDVAAADALAAADQTLGPLSVEALKELDASSERKPLNSAPQSAGGAGAVDAAATYERARVFKRLDLKTDEENAYRQCLKQDVKYAMCHYGLFELFLRDRRDKDANVACQNFIMFADTLKNAGLIQRCKKFLNQARQE